MKQGYCLVGVNGQVGSDDISLWHNGAQTRDGTRLAAGAKAVAIKQCLACQEVRKLFDVWILDYHGCKSNHFFSNLLANIK